MVRCLITKPSFRIWAGNTHSAGVNAAADEICRSQRTSDHGFRSVGAKLKAEFQRVFKGCLSSGESRAAGRSPAAWALSGL